MHVLLVVILVFFILYILFKGWLYSLRKRFEKHYEQNIGGHARMIDKGKMVKCSNCSTYFPSSEAIGKNKGGNTYYFCSEVCAKAFKK